MAAALDASLIVMALAVFGIVREPNAVEYLLGHIDPVQKYAEGVIE